MTLVKTAAARLAPLWAADRRLTALGLTMIPLLAATGVALVVDPREIGGAPAWLKPAKFAASIGIYALTLAWIFSHLPEWTKTRRAVSWITVITLGLEIVIIDLQAWRGTTSHFNVGTPLDAALFVVMGLAIVVQTAASVALAAAVWQHRFADRAIGWAIRLGLTITIIGAFSGGMMTQPTRAQLDDARAGRRMTVAGAHTVGAPDGGRGLPVTGWSREHGDLRVAHFIGLHAVQLLPLLALALRRAGWHERERARLAIAGAASYIALFGALVWQALRGQSITSPDAATLAVLAVWAVLSGAALWTAAHPSRAARTRALAV